jgi:hypothetical protein
MFRYLAVLGRNQREVCCQGNIAVYTIKKNKVRSSNTFEPKGKICALVYVPVLRIWILIILLDPDLKLSV